MQVKAKGNNLHETPRKLMLVAKSIKGMDALYAKEWLNSANKKAAKTMYKILTSAIANATNNHGMNAENLVISNAMVGVSHRRIKMATFSRTHVRFQVRKWAHAEIVLDQKTAIVAPKKAKRAVSAKVTKTNSSNLNKLSK